MRVAVIEGSKIANMVEAESLASIEGMFAEAIDAATLPEGVGIGWVRDSEGNWSAPIPMINYRPLAKAEFTALVSTGLTSAQKLALRKDVEMELAWMEIGDLGDAIPRDHDFTTAFLDAAVTNGHLTNAKRQAVLANWPQV